MIFWSILVIEIKQFGNLGNLDKSFGLTWVNLVYFSMWVSLSNFYSFGSFKLYLHYLGFICFYHWVILGSFCNLFRSFGVNFGNWALILIHFTIYIIRSILSKFGSFLFNMGYMILLRSIWVLLTVWVSLGSFKCCPFDCNLARSESHIFESAGSFSVHFLHFVGYFEYLNSGQFR